MARPDITDYNLTTADGQVSWNEDQYMHGAEGLPVQDDLDDRVAAGTDTFDEITRDDMGAMNTTTVAFRGVVAKSYSGGNVVELPQHPEPMDHMVRDALDSGDIFVTAGGTGPSWADQSDNTVHFDEMVIAEASKQIGTKLF